MKIRMIPFETMFRIPRMFSASLTLLMLFLPIMLPMRPAMAEDLMQILRLATERDPVFESEVYRHEAAPEQLTQAYSELMPYVSADSFYRRTHQEILSTDIAVYQASNVSYPAAGYTVALVQPILKLPSIYRVSQAKEELRRADLKFQLAKQDLVLRVAEAYSVALEAFDSLNFTSAEEAAVRSSFELAQSRYKSGLAPVTDFYDAKARLADTMALKVKVQNRMLDALEALKELTGQEVENVAALRAAPVGEIFPQAGQRGPENHVKGAGSGMPLISPDPNRLEEWVEAAAKQNLDVEAQRQAVEVAEREIKRQKAGHAPVVSVVGRLNRDYEGGSLFSGESDVNTMEAFVQMTVPIFQGFSVVSKTREAVKLYYAAKAGLEKELRGAQRVAKASFLGIQSSIENAEAFKQSVLSNTAALEAKKEGYKSGLFPALAVLDAERDLRRARQDYAKANYDYIIYSLRLKKAVGTLSEADLAAINQWLE